ncbi:hypothetical protein MBLNU457_5788t1 [Dothideomycetes sp. NU457]
MGQKSNVAPEPLCNSCFNRYVSTKVVKRMEMFRTRSRPGSAQTTLLLPLSFGVSSTAMLQVLDYHIDAQRQRSGHPAYTLHILHVDTSVVTGDRQAAERFEAIKTRYPTYTYTMAQLSDVMDQEEVLELAASILEEEQLHGSNEEKLHKMLSVATSPTARGDILESLRTKVIVATAKAHDCEAILWGDSTTRLAERTLSETAKGRGFALPWVVAESESVYGVRCQYPMRDLLKKELWTFADTTEPPLTPLLASTTTKPPVSAKNSTIDELTAQYFESVEREYPGIVANVVKTTGKLDLPAHTDAKVCRLCDVPVTESNPGGRQISTNFCASCSRTLANPA